MLSRPIGKFTKKKGGGGKTKRRKRKGEDKRDMVAKKEKLEAKKGYYVAGKDFEELFKLGMGSLQDRWNNIHPWQFLPHGPCPQ